MCRFGRRNSALPVMAAMLLWTLNAATISGIYAMRDIVDVPVDRLTANLETAIKANVNGRAVLTLRLNLARTHAMAYALKTETLKSLDSRQYADPDNRPDHVPTQVRNTEDGRSIAVARAHLSKAIELYRALVEDPAVPAPEPGYPNAQTALIARLGLAWCLDQSGDKPAAIAEYRRVVDSAWAVERNGIVVFPTDQSITQEASGYLIALLDPRTDQAEIKSLQARVSAVNGVTRRAVTPIAIPMRSGLTIDGVEGRSAHVWFDADGSGVAKPWTCISRDAAWLVSDMHRTRTVSSALQLFGNVTWWLFWDNGYQPLAALDDNRDGVITGPELQGLALWRDANSNGISEPGEVRPVSDYHIVSLSTHFEYDARHPDEMAWSPAGMTLADGSTRPTFDVVLHRR